MRGENFQGWAEVVLPTFGDVLNCNQKNGIKNKDYYSNVSALNSHQSLLKYCLKTNVASSLCKIFEAI